MISHFRIIAVSKYFSCCKPLTAYVTLSCSQPLMKLSNFWVSSLAVTDILMAAFVMPVATYFNVQGPWELGGAICKVSKR